MQRRHPSIQRDLIVLQITGHLFFLGMSLLSVYFWKERQAFDAAHYLYELVDRQFFFIAHQRPIGIVSQVLPLIGIWLKLPLTAVAILYSLGDILWYYLLFLLLAYKFESRRGIISLLLMLSLTVRYSFFCPVTELLQAGALLPVWMSILDRSFRFRLPLLIALAALIIFSHPLLFIPLSFCLAWWMFSSTKQQQFLYNDRRSLLIVLWGSIAIITVLKLLLLDSYDHGKTFYPVVYNDYGYVQSFRLDTLLHHLGVVIKAYPALTLVFIAAVLATGLFRRWKSMSLIVVFVVGYMITLSLTHRFDQISNYYERMLLPIPMMLSIVAGYLVTITRTFFSRLAGYVGLVMVLLLHCDLLRITAIPYTYRVNYIEEINSASLGLNIRKAIVDENILEQNSFAMSGWSYPIESLILSSYKGRDSSVTLALQHEHLERIAEQKNTVDRHQWIKWTEFILPVTELNQEYFHLPASPYASLSGTYSSYVDTVRFEMTDARRLKNGSVVLQFTIEPTKGTTLSNGDSLRIEFRQKQQFLHRMNIPFAVSGKQSIHCEIPTGLEKEVPVEVNLIHGPKTLGRLNITRDGDHIEERK